MRTRSCERNLKVSMNNERLINETDGLYVIDVG